MKLAWRTNQQFWLSHNAVLYSWCSFSFLPVNHYPKEFNILRKKKKNTNELGPAWQNTAGNHRIPWQKKIGFSYSDPGDTLENKLNDLKPLYSRKKSFAFQKKLKKMLFPWRVNLTDQNKQQPQGIKMRVRYHTWPLSMKQLKPLIDTCKYCVTSRTNQALRSLANAGFQNRGVCLQPFPSFPSPSLLFHFVVLVSFLARSKPKIPFHGPF